MTDRELLQRVLDEYDENMLRTPSFVTMELIREQLSARCTCGEDLVFATVRTHDPSKYTLHNSEDGTVWQMTAGGSWRRT